jgi:Ring hydroxylating alpha subunit (catalytic domain)
LTNRIMVPGVEGWLTDSQNETMESLWAGVPEERTEEQFIEQFYTRVYVDGASNGVPLPPRPALGHAYVFPNVALINHLGNTLFYRFLPDGGDAQACTWEIWCMSQRAGGAPLERPRLEELTSPNELPPVYAQDVSNMALQQRGIRSRGFTHDVYAPDYENMIIRMHQLLDHYLAR